jgi:hypothetical protein
MTPWWKRLVGAKKFERAAIEFIQAYGEHAQEMARIAALAARRRRDTSGARHFSFIRHRIAELKAERRETFPAPE